MSMCVCVWNVFECEKTYTKAWAAITWNTYWIYWVALTHFTTLLRTVTVNPYREKLEAPARGQPRSTCGYGMLPSSAQDLPNGKWANQALASEHCLPHLPASLKSGGFQPQQINAATQWNKNTPGQGICMHGWGSRPQALNWEGKCQLCWGFVSYRWWKSQGRLEVWRKKIQDKHSQVFNVEQKYLNTHTHTSISHLSSPNFVP